MLDKHSVQGLFVEWSISAERNQRSEPRSWCERKNVRVHKVKKRNLEVKDVEQIFAKVEGWSQICMICKFNGNVRCKDVFCFSLSHGEGKPALWVKTPPLNLIHPTFYIANQNKLDKKTKSEKCLAPSSIHSDTSNDAS